MNIILRHGPLARLRRRGPRTLSPTLNMIAAVCLAVVLSGCGTGELVRVSDNVKVDPAELAGEIGDVRLVFVGEHHDDKLHHRRQLMVIRALHESGVDLAVGLEMFQAADQDILDRWSAGEDVKDEFIDTYYASWNIPWSQYRDIFLYARENRIALVGLNVPKELIRQVFDNGFESLTDEQLAMMPGVSCNVDEKYEDFIRRAMGKHDHGSGGEDDDDSFRSFCEAQMVWDTSMAYRIVEYLKKNPEKVMVVLAGSAHSWKRGIPAQVKRQGDFSYVVILPESTDSLKIEDLSVEDTDYVWLRPL